MKFERVMRKMSIVLTMLAMVGFLFGPVLAGEKSVTVFWEQAEEDLPVLDHWELFSSTDSGIPFVEWKKEGDITYTVGMPLTTDIVLTVPDGQETSLWFKMIAVAQNGTPSDPSELQENAPTVIDFKAPVPAVLSSSYNNQTKTVTLTWTVDPADTDIVSQKIFKSSVAGGPYIDIGEATSPYAYVVQPSDSGKWMYFVAVLTDNDGNFSQNSNEVAVKLSMGVPFNVRVTVSSQ